MGDDYDDFMRDLERKTLADDFFTPPEELLNDEDLEILNEMTPKRKSVSGHMVKNVTKKSPPVKKPVRKGK